MSALTKSILLFLMNWLDAQLTIFWVRANLATEGNGFMAKLLDMGNAPFLTFKLVVGGFAAYILYRCSNNPLARRGMTFVLGVYGALMLVHAATGMSALGWSGPELLVAHVSRLGL
jgi:Domain of unknown function (DUF5658)